MEVCTWCGGEFELRGIKTHEVWCLENPSSPKYEGRANPGVSAQETGIVEVEVPEVPEVPSPEVATEEQATRITEKLEGLKESIHQIQDNEGKLASILEGHMQGTDQHIAEMGQEVRTELGTRIDSLSAKVISALSTMSEMLKDLQARGMTEEEKANVVSMMMEGIAPVLDRSIHKNIEELLPGIEQRLGDRVTADTSEALCALNWRIAQTTKKYGDFMDDVKRLVDSMEAQVIGSETEKPEEEVPGVQPRVKPQEEPEAEKRECVEVIGLCPNCHIGYTQKEKDDGFKHCVECGDKGQSPKIGWLESPIIGYCRSSETCNVVFEKGDEHHEECPKCGGTLLVWYLKGETNPVKPSGEQEPLVGYCDHCSLGFTQEEKDDDKFKKCPNCGRAIEWD